MGICSSCLGIGRRSPEAESTERSRLLRQDSQHRHYGGSYEEDSTPPVDPEELERERDALERICAETAEYGAPSFVDLGVPEVDILGCSNLIDISHTDEGSKTASDYARLFNETFPAAILHKYNDNPSAEAEDERTWIRNIISNSEPDDKSWDCNIVHEIHKPLTFTFD